MSENNFMIFGTLAIVSARLSREYGPLEVHLGVQEEGPIKIGFPSLLLAKKIIKKTGTIGVNQD